MALRKWAGSLPPSLWGGSCGRLRRVTEEEAVLVSLSQAVTPGLFRAAGAKEAAAAPLTSSFPLPGSLQAVSSARPEPLLPGQSRLWGSRFCSYKVFLWAEAAAGPPGPPRPRRPRGWGGGGGSKNSSRSPAEGPGGRRLAKREDPPPPRGGSGEEEGKERTAAPVLLSPAARAAASHLGPRPPGRGVVAELGSPAHTLWGKMLRPRAGGRGSGVVGDPAGSARRRPRSRLPHVSLRLGPPPYTLGVPRPAPRDETEAPALPQRLLTAEQLTSPGPR